MVPATQVVFYTLLITDINDILKMFSYYLKEALLATLLAVTLSDAAPAANNTLAARASANELEGMKFIPWIPIRNLKDWVCELYDPDDSLPKKVRKQLEGEFNPHCCDKIEYSSKHGSILGIPLARCVKATPFNTNHITEAPGNLTNGKKDCTGVRKRKEPMCCKKVSPKGGMKDNSSRPYDIICI